MKTFPNCKINLGLHVIGKRPDGYHDLETIFVPVYRLQDELEIRPARFETEILLDGIPLDSPPEENLCMKAWQLLHDEFGVPPVRIRLKKKIPFGAGLGGGSSDAAFTLKELNRIYLGFDKSTLERYAARLGADCAFFIKNRPAYATGIGDQLEPLKFKLATLLEKYVIKIEIPEGEHVSTKEAYANLNLDKPRERPDLREAIKLPIREWKNYIVNDFEKSVFPAHPAIAALKEDMVSRGALYASMTGSGAAVFGIFPRKKG